MLKRQLTFIKECLAAYKTFYQFLKSDRNQFVALFLIILGVASSNTLMIWLLGQPFDYLAKENFDGLAEILFILFLVIVINQSLHFLTTYRSNVVALRFVGRLRTTLLSRILNLPYILTEEVAKGDLLTRVSHDVDKVQNFVVAFPLYTASHFFTVLFYCAMLIYLDWKLALVALLLSSVYLVHQHLFAEKKQRYAQGFYQANGDLLANEDEVLTNTKLVSGFNAQEKIHNHHKSLFEVAFGWAKKERKLNALFTTSLAILIYFCALIIVYLGIHKIEEESLSIAELMSFLLYMGYLSVPLRGMTELVFEAQSDIMAGKRIESLLSIDQSIHENLPPIKVTKGQIEFQHLSCQLGDKKIFDDFSVILPAGKTIAIVGESGTGKSTLANLIMRYVNADQGVVTIDEQNVRHHDIQSLRNSVTIVWQMPLMFSDTIKNNLLLAKPDASDKDLELACIQSDAWDFVKSLPNGLNTRIGTAGVELSAGQTQRLHISQAFLRNPPILIMDEASSALDSQSEGKIIEALKNIRKDKTTLLIAHRYSSVRHADLVIYLNGDGTISKGTHEDLLKSHKAYQKALQWQTELS